MYVLHLAVIMGLLSYGNSRLIILTYDCWFGLLRSSSNCLIQAASCAALARATYSASAVDSATQVCFLLFQLVATPLMLNNQT